jgi:DNA-binding transcriptional MerR regulator
MATRTTQDRLSISQVSELLGIPVPTIRSWERRYEFPSPARTEGKHRRYAPEEVDRLRALRDEITKGHPARRAVELVRSGGREVARSEFLDRFTEAAQALDVDGVRRSLDQGVEVIGVERAIVEVAMPGMRELGDQWQSGRCDVATEHAATTVVRQWFARLSAATPPPFRSRPLVMATGPTELHTIGLEAFAVLLGRRGWPIRMLGALTPTDALVAALMSSRSTGTIITAQRSVGRRGAIESLRAADRISGLGVFYAGNAFSTPRSRDGVPGRYLGTDLVTAAELVGSVIR